MHIIRKAGFEPMTLDSIDNCSTTEAATTRVERSLLIFSLSQAQGMLSPKPIKTTLNSYTSPNLIMILYGILKLELTLSCSWNGLVLPKAWGLFTARRNSAYEPEPKLTTSLAITQLPHLAKNSWMSSNNVKLTMTKWKLRNPMQRNQL